MKTVAENPQHVTKGPPSLINRPLLGKTHQKCSKGKAGALKVAKSNQQKHHCRVLDMVWKTQINNIQHGEEYSLEGLAYHYSSLQ